MRQEISTSRPWGIYLNPVNAAQNESQIANLFRLPIHDGKVEAIVTLSFYPEWASEDHHGICIDRKCVFSISPLFLVSDPPNYIRTSTKSRRRWPLLQIHC